MPPLHPQSQSPLRRHLWWWLPAALGVLVHLPILFNGLLWDDDSLITNHPQLARPEFLFEIFQRDYGLEFGGRNPNGYYRPFFMLIAFGLRQAFGPAPVVYHATSLLFFAALTIVVTRLFFVLTGRRSRGFALAAGLLFALHPMQVEFVAFFCSVPDLTVSLCAGLLLLVALRPKASAWRLNPAAPAWGPFTFANFFALGAAVAFVAALFKGSAFFVFGSVAVVLMALAARDFIFRFARRSAKARRDVASGSANLRRADLYLPIAFGILAGLVGGLLMRRYAEVVNIAGERLFLAPFTPKGAVSALWSVGYALSRFFLPRQTVFFMEPPTAPSMLAVGAVGAVVLLLAAYLGALGWTVWRRRPALALMLAWLGGGNIPLILTTAYGLPYGDRYVAFPPLVFLTAWTVRPLLARLRSRISARAATSDAFAEVAAKPYAPVLFSLLLLFCASGVFLTEAKCLNATTFWMHARQERPDSLFPRLGLATELFWTYGDFEQAERLVLEAIAMRPNLKNVRSAGVMLGQMYIVQERYDDAERILNWSAERLDEKAEIPRLLGVCAYARGDVRGALAYIREAIALEPDTWNYRHQFVRHALADPAIPIEILEHEIARIAELGGEIPEEFSSRHALAEARRRILASRPLPPPPPEAASAARLHPPLSPRLTPSV